MVSLQKCQVTVQKVFNTESIQTKKLNFENTRMNKYLIKYLIRMFVVNKYISILTLNNNSS